MPPLRRPLSLCAAALGLGLCADVLFYGRAPGLSAPLFVALLLAAHAWLSRAEGRPATPANRWLGAAALLFAALVAVRASPLLITLNILAALGLLLLHAALYRGEALGRLEGWRLGLGAAHAAVAAALMPVPLAVGQASRVRVSGGQARALLVVGRGAALATPILLIFAALLAMADHVFATYLSEVMRLQLPFDLAAAAPHALLVALVAWAVAGSLVVALREHPAGTLLGPRVADLPAEGDTQRLSPPDRTRFLGWGEAITVLTLVDTLFASFMLIQGAYLFGGLDTLERTGMTFANYARRGFFELVTVACLSLGLLWTLALVARRRQGWQRRAFNGAAAVMVLLVLGMLASAALRMWLYEQAYGFTLLRLLTHSFMAWLAVVLLLFLAALLLARPRLFSLGVGAAAIAYLVALNLINPDAMIVRQNLARYQATGDLDAPYLMRLSPDATPQLAAALPLAGPHREPLVSHLRELAADLAAAAERDGLPGWNFGRARAAAVLRPLAGSP